MLRTKLRAAIDCAVAATTYYAMDPVQAHDLDYSENKTEIVCFDQCNLLSTYHSLLSNEVFAIERGPCSPQEFVVTIECLTIGKDERQDQAHPDNAVDEEKMPQYMMFTGQFEHVIEYCFTQKDDENYLQLYQLPIQETD